MFSFNRTTKEKLYKYALIFFLSIVCLSMVIVMAPIGGGDTSTTQSNVLASIGNNTVTSQELDEHIRDEFRNSPNGMNPRMIAMFAPTVLDQLVIDQILVEEAHKMGIEVTDAEVLKTFEGIPWLYPGGNFVGAEQAAQMISANTGKTLPQFEALIRDSLLEDKIRGIVTDGVQVTPGEVLAQYRRRNNKTKIDYVTLDPSQFIKDVKITPEALAATFKINSAKYKLPEQRQLRYVMIDADLARARVNVTDAELHDYYAQHLSDYRVPDRVKVAHILFKTTGKTPAEAATLEKTAADVLNQIRAGANFGDLARKYSEDSTAQAGGELGWIVHGQTVPNFESTAFGLKPGEVSGLVKTEYGIHIIKVEDKQVAHLQTFDELKGSIQAELEKQRIADVQDSLANSLATQIKANPQQFADIVTKAGFVPRETPLFKFNQPVPDLGKSDGLDNLAFQLKINEVGGPVSVPRGEAVIQLIQVSPEHVPSLDEVRPQVEEDFRHEDSITLAREKAEKLAELAKTEDFDKAAKSLGLTPKTSNDFSESEYVEGAGNGSQLTGAFTLDPGQVSNVISVGTNQVVFKVISHTPANDADFAAQRDQIEEELLSQKRSLEFEIYRQNLKEQFLRSGQLKLNDAGMKQYLASYQNQ